MTGTLSDYVRRVKLARKSAGLSVDAAAAALSITKREYRRFERDELLPLNQLAPFCALTRCSPLFLLTGHATEERFPKVVAPPNKCGGPCQLGTGWCRSDCSLRM